jgi:hypothetical protein
VESFLACPAPAATFVQALENLEIALLPLLEDIGRAYPRERYQLFQTQRALHKLVGELKEPINRSSIIDLPVDWLNQSGLLVENQCGVL